MLLNDPQKLSPRFGGIETLLKTPTKKEYLRCRLTPDIEFKLLFILQNVSDHCMASLFLLFIKDSLIAAIQSISKKFELVHSKVSQYTRVRTFLRGYCKILGSWMVSL